MSSGPSGSSRRACDRCDAEIPPGTVYTRVGAFRINPESLAPGQLSKMQTLCESCYKEWGQVLAQAELQLFTQFMKSTPKPVEVLHG